MDNTFVEKRFPAVSEQINVEQRRKEMKSGEFRLSSQIRSCAPVIFYSLAQFRGVASSFCIGRSIRQSLKVLKIRLQQWYFFIVPFKMTLFVRKMNMTPFFSGCASHCFYGDMT